MPASGMFGNSALLISVNLEIRVEALERVIRCIFVSRYVGGAAARRLNISNHVYHLFMTC